MVGSESALDDFINAHRFTSQTKRELMEWIPEIAFRENISVDDVVSSEAIQFILQNPKLNAPQKHQKIRDEMYKKRFPEFSKLRDRWKKIAASANPNPSKIQFIPSPGFEKKRLEIKLTVENTDEALEVLKSLSKIPLYVWDELLCPGKI
jgi:hypothetical protein